MITKKKIEKILKRNDFADEAEFLKKINCENFDDGLTKSSTRRRISKMSRTTEFDKLFKKEFDKVYNKGRLDVLKDEERFLEQLKKDMEIKGKLRLFREYSTFHKRLSQIQKEIREIENGD